MCHVSPVTCHLSHVMCHVSPFIYLYIFRCASISRSDDCDWLNDWLIDLPIGNWESLRSLRTCHSKWNVTQNKMSLKTKCHSNGMSLNMECHSKWNVTLNGMPLKVECHSRLEIESPSDPSELVTQNGMSLKIKCHSKQNVTLNGISLKMEFHLIWNVTQNGISFTMEC